MSLRDKSEHIQLWINSVASTEYKTGLYGTYDIEIMNYTFYTAAAADDLIELRSTVLVKTGQQNQYFLAPCAFGAFNSNNSNQIFKNIKLNNTIDFELYNKVSGDLLQALSFKFGLLDLQLTRVD
jgi:hypothetical protein